MSDQYGAKAENLAVLAGIPGIAVPAFTRLSDNQTGSDDIHETVRTFLSAHNPRAVAVRSSGRHEDGDAQSGAGAYQSQLNIAPEADAILQAITDIRRHAAGKFGDDEGALPIIVQEMVPDISFAGVLFSHDLADDRPYVTVNFSAGSGDQIASGQTNGHHLRIYRPEGGFDRAYRDEIRAHYPAYPFLGDLMAAMEKVEETFGHQHQDIEFAVSGDGRLYLLQARPLVMLAEDDYSGATFVDPVKLHTQLTEAQQEAQAHTASGDVLSNMADINPRELLGPNPSPLAVSLYRLMFADNIVSDVRRQLGYRGTGEGLAHLVDGMPYISVMNSGESLLPAGLPDALAGKLRQHYASRLAAENGLHAQVEFGLYAVTAEAAMALPDTFSAQEKAQLTDAIAKQTAQMQLIADATRAFHPTISRAYNRRLTRMAGRLGDQNQPSEAQAQDALSTLLDGTAYFVRVARLAFAAQKKFTDAYGKAELDDALAGLHSVSSQLDIDLLDYAAGKLDKADIVKRYGHLRAGQFDPECQPYRADPERFFDLPRYRDMDAATIANGRARHTKNKARYRVYESALGLEKTADVDALRDFMRMREAVKFDFMRAYEVVLHDVEAMAAAGIRPQSATLAMLQDAHAKGAQPSRMYRPVLPDVITPATDLRMVDMGISSGGRYFTQETVEAETVLITADTAASLTRDDVAGRIVLLESADPGYDFILNMDPAALVTAYGGPASHMAIRVAEKGLPACIGCGPSLFRDISADRMLVLDCAGQAMRAGREIEAKETVPQPDRRSPHDHACPSRAVAAPVR